MARHRDIAICKARCEHFSEAVTGGCYLCDLTGGSGKPFIHFPKDQFEAQAVPTDCSFVTEHTVAVADADDFWASFNRRYEGRIAERIREEFPERRRSWPICSRCDNFVAGKKSLSCRLDGGLPKKNTRLGRADYTSRELPAACPFAPEHVVSLQDEGREQC